MSRLIKIMLIVFVLILIVTARDTEITRDQIPEKYKWNLKDLYESNDQWAKKKQELEGMLEKFDTYKGKLATSADILYECMEYYSLVLKEYYRSTIYASRLSDQDTRKAGPMEMVQEIGQLGTNFSAKTAFIDPELLSIDSKTIAKLMKDKPELEKYARYIDNVQRLKKHTLSKEEEEIVSQSGLLSDAPYDVYGIFKNADMPRPVIKTTDGTEISLDDAAFTLYRADSDREFRKMVFETFFGAYEKFERTFGAQLYAQVKTDIYTKNVRNYNSCLEAALNVNKIPTEVYKSLISTMRDNLGTLHRYLDIRKRMLGVDKLHYYDMYPSLVSKVDMSYTVEAAEKLLLKALKPLGKDYVATVDKAFNNRWIDMKPNTGKRSGAYSSGAAYDVHPYILMNYNGKYEDVSTLAHELGHTMHSYYSNKNQDFINANYPIFLAEVASTTNEALLVDYMLKKTKDDQKRLSILGNQLETYRQTIFRQTQFAEFELKIHEVAEKGEALSGEKLTKMYLEILKDYYGHDKGVTTIDDIYGIEWAYIPHFYYNFYVFQYATSLCAAAAISEKILAEGDKMRDKYLKEFLSAGKSDYAIPIMKRIDVDMTTTEPFELAIKKMNKIMDEIEEILNK